MNLWRLVKGRLDPWAQPMPTGQVPRQRPWPAPPAPTLIQASTDRTVAVDRGYAWQPIESCPQGLKVQLLTRHGIAVHGQYRLSDRSFIAWAPLPSIPPEIKEKLK